MVSEYETLAKVALIIRDVRFFLSAMGCLPLLFVAITHHNHSALVLGKSLRLAYPFTTLIHVHHLLRVIVCEWIRRALIRTARRLAQDIFTLSHVCQRASALRRNPVTFNGIST